MGSCSGTLHGSYSETDSHVAVHDPLDSDLDLSDLGHHEDGRVVGGEHPGSMHSVPADHK